MYVCMCEWGDLSRSISSCNYRGWEVPPYAIYKLENQGASSMAQSPCMKPWEPIFYLSAWSWKPEAQGATGECPRIQRPLKLGLWCQRGEKKWCPSSIKERPNSPFLCFLLSGPSASRIVPAHSGGTSLITDSNPSICQDYPQIHHKMLYQQPRVLLNAIQLTPKMNHYTCYIFHDLTHLSRKDYLILFFTLLYFANITFFTNSRLVTSLLSKFTVAFFQQHTLTSCPWVKSW